MYLIRYDEISLKGRNRRDFENILFENIKFKTKKLKLDVKIERKYGKFIIKLLFEKNNKNISLFESILLNTPGIHSFANVFTTNLDKQFIVDKSVNIIKSYISDQKTSKKDFFSFKVEVNRSNKQFPMKSPEIARRLGGEILDYFGNKLVVDLHNPDIKLFINISEKQVFLYTNKKLGLGGLPSRSSGRIISLLSGGIDSPVASIMMMQRGCEVILFHAYNHGTNTEAIKNKIELLAKKISFFQGKINLVMIPYRSIQKEIIGHIPGPYRMISFKRSIVRMANNLAKKFNAKSIINGDSVGQVASQTLENIQCVHYVSTLPILSPLIGMQKIDIIKLSKKFGTYDISVLPYDDCCSLIATGNPATRGNLEEIEKLEKDTNLLNIEFQLVEDINIIQYDISDYYK